MLCEEMSASTASAPELSSSGALKVHWWWWQVQRFVIRFRRLSADPNSCRGPRTLPLGKFRRSVLNTVFSAPAHRICAAPYPTSAATNHVCIALLLPINCADCVYTAFVFGRLPTYSARRRIRPTPPQARQWSRCPRLASVPFCPRHPASRIGRGAI